jgi:hypothetical protein
MIANKDIRIINTNNILSSEIIQDILTLPEVINAKIQTDSLRNGSIYFSIKLTSSIKETIYNKLNIQLENIEHIPMRWIKGDSLPHIDTCGSSFDNTYLMYLTDCPGEFVIEDTSYDIKQGCGFVFPEGVYHKTVNTNNEPRLLLGPMNEKGLAVGGFSISAPGGSTIYLRQGVSYVEYSLDDITWSQLYLPCGISNTSTGNGNLVIEFKTDITLVNPYDYFLCFSEKIQFGSSLLKEDGTVPIVTVDGVSNYPGLINNGSSGSNGYNNITIINLEIKTTGGSTLTAHAGWFAQEYYSRNATDNLIKNCFTTAPIDGGLTTAKGGIAGSHLAYDNGIIIIIGCYSTGNIGTDGGGIVSQQAGENYGTVEISRCWSSGTTTNNSGGIVGQAAGDNNGTVIITNCYTTGTIGTESGGIVGRYACGDTSGVNTNGNVYVSDSYSTGYIGQDSGGIIGTSSLNSVTVINCFSTGALSDAGNNAAGGIFGYNSVNTSLQTANNCYSSGMKPGYTQGGIFGDSSSDNRPGSSNNYSEENNSGSGWSNTNAFSVLTGVPTITTYGTTWFQPNGTNTPLLLSNSGYTPYSRSLVNSILVSLIAGEYTSSGIVSGYTYSILQINNTLPSAYPYISINSTTGVITATSSTPAGVYSIVVYSTKNPYSITSFAITITSGGGSGGSSPLILVGRGSNSNGQFWYGGSIGFPGFLYKKNVGVGARRSTKFAPGGNVTCNSYQYIYNKYKPGSGGIGASSTSNRRAKNRLATVCGGVNNGKCGMFYTYLGRYDNYTENPNGYFPYP